jgi:hypothetical protein
MLLIDKLKKIWAWFTPPSARAAEDSPYRELTPVNVEEIAKKYRLREEGARLGAGAVPVSSPTPIELKFQPTPPSAVKPETFKVLYGSFEIDITKRILNVAKVTEAGVFVQEANLPKGKHKLLMVVEDTAGRRGNRSVDFEVK